MNLSRCGYASALVAVAAVSSAYAEPPGAVNPYVVQRNIGVTICRPNWTDTVRPPVRYTDRLKARQLGTTVGLRLYEEDHMIPLTLGGHPTAVANLWPQLYAGACGARVKDRLEVHLNKLVCRGRLTLASARASIRRDWRAAYRKYVGPLSCEGARWRGR